MNSRKHVHFNHQLITSPRACNETQRLFLIVTWYLQASAQCKELIGSTSSVSLRIAIWLRVFGSQGLNCTKQQRQKRCTIVLISWGHRNTKNWQEVTASNERIPAFIDPQDLRWTSYEFRLLAMPSNRGFNHNPAYHKSKIIDRVLACNKEKW